MWLSEDDKEK
jgi:hypothetical protein